MITWMWNLDKMMQDAEDRALINPADTLDTASILKRCEEREARFAENAIDAERDGDSEAAWFAMAARAENKRIMEKIKTDLRETKKVV